MNIDIEEEAMNLRVRAKYLIGECSGLLRVTDPGETRWLLRACQEFLNRLLKHEDSIDEAYEAEDEPKKQQLLDFGSDGHYAAAKDMLAKLMQDKDFLILFKESVTFFLYHIFFPRNHEIILGDNSY